MKCEKCGAKIPDDSVFCTECGAQLTEASFATKKNFRKVDASQFEQVKTIWPTLSFVLWALTTVIFNVAIPILFNMFHWPYMWSYYVCIVLYVVVIGLGARGYIEDRRLLKQNKTAKGNTICFSMMIFSVYLIIQTIQYIMKG